MSTPYTAYIVTIFYIHDESINTLITTEERDKSRLNNINMKISFDSSPQVYTHNRNRFQYKNSNYKTDLVVTHFNIMIFR